MLWDGTEKTLVLPEIGTITYEEGMTWGEWCNSKYNKYGLYVGNNPYNTVAMNIYCGNKMLYMKYYTEEYGYGTSYVDAYLKINKSYYEDVTLSGYYWEIVNNNVS